MSAENKDTITRYQPIVDVLSNPRCRQALINDCVGLIETHVGQKSGISGMAIKTAFAGIKKISPQVIYKAMDALVDDLAMSLEPFVAKDPSNIANTFRDDVHAICVSLLKVSDQRVKSVDIDLVQSIYKRLRPKAHKHIEPAVPDIGQIIDTHLSRLAQTL